MRPSFPTICYYCANFVSGFDPGNFGGRPACRAFPEGIPDKILAGGFDHRNPYLGDEWFLFEPGEGVTEEDVEEWERDVLEIMKQDFLGVIREFQKPMTWDD